MPYISIYRNVGADLFLGIRKRRYVFRTHSNYFTEKITLVVGHSGVGKSTLLNKISPGLEQRVGDISRFSQKGTHTTTFAEMFTLNENSYVIDIPWC